jgi:hypothetical protein
MTLPVNLARLAVALAVTAILATVPGSVLAQSAASFIVAIGEVQVVNAAGQSREGERGGPLAPGDQVITGANGLAQIRFSDGAMLSVRANSDLKIQAHSYSGASDTLATTVLQLLKGGLRAITGAVARQNRSGYRVVTATATIGVRGTDFEAFYVPAATAGGLTPPGEPGTYLRVTRGVAFLQTPLGSLDVQPQQIGFAPLAAVAPQLLPQTPQFMLAPPRPAPEPAPKSQPPQRSQGGTDGPTVRQMQPFSPQQVDPGRTLTAPSTSPTLSPGPTGPATISPTPIAPTTSPTLTSPSTSPTVTSPTLSPSITSPATTSPSMTPSTTSPMLSPSMTSPPVTAPTR